MRATGLPPVQVSQDSWEYQGCKPQGYTSSPSIPGYLGIPNSPGIIPGCKPQVYPQSKYPRIPGITRQSQDYPGMQATGLYLQSKYPRIPGNTRQSRDHPGMQATGLPPVQVSQDSWEYQTVPGSSRDASHRATPSPSIPGFLGIPDSPGIIPGCKPQGYPQSKYPRIPGNTRQSRDANQRATPPVQVSQDYWEYQTVPGSSRDASHRATPSPSIPGFLGILYRQYQDYPVTAGMTSSIDRATACPSTPRLP